MMTIVTVRAAGAALLTVCALVVSALVDAGPALAAQRNLGADARWIMSLSYAQFIDYKYHAHHDYPFDFSSDGCTSTPNGLRQIFDQPCQHHDFGYRNFGNGLRLGRDDTTRLWIDDRFHTEMDRLCADQHRGFAEQGNLTVCRYQSQVIYDQVRQHGRGAYFG